MKQTLQIGDHILVNKFVYGVKIPYLRKTIIPIKNPRRGDIVVFKYPVDPNKDFIKRVVGLPGDRIAIVDNRLVVNGEAVTYSPLDQELAAAFEPQGENPASYESHVLLNDPDQGIEGEPVRIWMNNPLRYANLTFYQSGYDDTTGVEVTDLQVVRNLGWRHSLGLAQYENIVRDARVRQALQRWDEEWSALQVKVSNYLEDLSSAS